MTVHFVDRARGELRPACGASFEESTWTTLPGLVTCPRCGHLERLSRTRRRFARSIVGRARAPEAPGA